MRAPRPHTPRQGCIPCTRQASSLPYFYILFRDSEEFGQILAYQIEHFRFTDGSGSAIFVFTVDPGLDFHNAGVVFADIDSAGEICMNPVGDSGESGGVGNGDLAGTFQELFRIEDVIDFFIFCESVRMDTCPSGVEIGADERIVVWNVVTDLITEELRHVSNDSGVDAVMNSSEAHPFENKAFDWGISGPFPESEESSVCCGTSIDPCGDGICQDFMEIVVTMMRMVVRHTMNFLNWSPNQQIQMSCRKLTRNAMQTSFQIDK